MKNNILIFFLCLLILTFNQFCSLKKDSMIPKEEQNRTNIINPMFDFPYTITQKAGGQIEIQANLKSKGNLNIHLHGWVWSESSSSLPDIFSPNQKKEGRLDANANSFKHTLETFLLNKKYIIRPFVITGKDTIYGDPMEFQMEVAELSKLMEVFVQACQVELKVSIQFSTDQPPIGYGFVYNTVKDSIVNATIKPITRPVSSIIQDSIIGLLPETTYYVWAYSISPKQGVRSWTGPTMFKTPSRPFNNVDIDYKMSNELFLGTEALFDAKVDGNVTYKWYFGTEGSLMLKNPSYTFKKTDSYKVILEAQAQGCVIKDSINLKIVQNPFAAPNYWVDVKGTGSSGFQMGCDATIPGAPCDSENNFVHTVVLDDFKIGKTEVTQKQWSAVVKTTPSAHRGCDDCPVENISWNDTREFLDSLFKKTGIKYSLPTEAQWEYAARGGKLSIGYLYSGSNTASEVAYSNSKSKTQEVSLKKENELLLFDMSGNVAEWCKDFFDPNYYSKSPKENPENLIPNRDKERVLRGGAFSNFYGDTNVFSRYHDAPDQIQDVYGFRLVKNLK